MEPTSGAPLASAQEVVDAWSRGPALRGVSVGVAVWELRPGATKVVAQLDAHTPRYTASVAKLLTSVAALRRFAPDTTWATRVYGELRPGGVVRGPLTLRGEGDPKLTPASVRALADGCWDAGVRAVPQGLLVDGTAFAPPAVPPGYDEKPSTAGYRASVGAVGSNFGAVWVSVRPGRRVGAPVRVRVTPASGGVRVVVRAHTVVGRAEALRYALRPAAKGRMELVVGGTLGVRARRVRERRRVLSPDAWTGHLLVAALRRRGVTVGGGVRLGQASAAPGRLLAEVRSEPLAQALRDLLTWSNNYMAEVVFKHLGREDAGPHAAPAPARWDRAQAAVAAAVRALGVPEGEVKVVNGSGLYHGTMASAGALAELLARVHRDPALGPLLWRALPVSGRTGTLAHRLGGPLRGRVHAKTGTLDDVVSLAGYLAPRHGPTVAFAILVNDATARRTAALRQAVDGLVRRLARRYRRRH